MSKHLLMSVVLLMVVWSLSVPTVGSAQGTSLISACVDQQGRLRIVAPGTSCGARETLLTWPAEPTTPDDVLPAGVRDAAGDSGLRDGDCPV
jgi:hypothetical protein